MTGQKGEQPELLHQGIPLSFQSFSLADHVKVAGANVEHGMLTIDLVREVPNLSLQTTGAPCARLCAHDRRGVWRRLKRASIPRGDRPKPRHLHCLSLRL